MTKLGLYVGNDASQLAAAEEWLGRPVDHVLNYLNDRSWSAFDSSIPYEIDLWDRAGAPLMLSVPLTVQGTSLEQVATGAFNGHFLRAARALAASDDEPGPIYVRVGWEFNGDWMPWAAAGHETAFIAAFRQLVDTFRSVSGEFRFVWDANLGGSMDPATAYPGDAYVDVIGMDVYYDQRWDPADAATAFQSKVSQPYGLRWQQDFAAAHGKETAISEWGVRSDNSGEYIRRFADWMDQHDMLFANYWESDAAGYPGTLHRGRYPNAAAAFREEFASAEPDDPAPSTGGPLVLRVSGDHYRGHPHFIVTVDGEQVGGVQVATASHAAGQVQDVVLDVQATPGRHEVAVRFIDDLHGGSAGDRNLYVHELRWGGETYAGDEAVNSAGRNSAGTANMYSAGQAVFQVGSEDTLSVRVSGDSYRGDPHFTVAVDGRVVGSAQAVTASHAAGQSQVFVFDGQFGPGPHEVTIRFLDDLYGGTAATDRNLYVHEVRWGDEVHAGAEAVNKAGHNSGGTANMYSAGQATFQVGGTDTLSVRVSGDSYRGDPHFTVAVDGRPVGTAQAVTASHAAGQSQEFVFQGQFGSGPHEVSIRFIDDLYGGTAARDRNLYVHEVAIDGVSISGDAGRNGAGWNSPGLARAYSEGEIVYQVSASDGLWHV